jgi:hypothetical protein
MEKLKKANGPPLPQLSQGELTAIACQQGQGMEDEAVQAMSTSWLVRAYFFLASATSGPHPVLPFRNATAICCSLYCSSNYHCLKKRGCSITCMSKTMTDSPPWHKELIINTTKVYSASRSINKGQ